jgi:alpha-tubulin suppressor-like RCC1 family protein
MVGRFAFILIVLTACGEQARYTCVTSSQCVLAGDEGTCEPDGHCAFPDPACDSGRRYEAQAGDGFGGVCVGAIIPCGTLGGTCCATGATCGENLFCDTGMCQQCVTDVALGGEHSCYLKYDGTVWCSGENEDGELGNGTVVDQTFSMVSQVRDAAGPITNVIAVSSGNNYTCAIRSDNTLWCWGANDNCADESSGLGGGQLGNNSNAVNSPVAVQVQRADGQPFNNVVEVVADYCRACARDSTGGVWCWGQNAYGGLGEGNTAPFFKRAVPVRSSMGGPPVTGVAELSSNGHHACYRTTSNQVYCWGANYSGQLGNDDFGRNERSIPEHVFDGNGVAAGRAHTCGTKADGTAWCWGSNRHGRLGNGAGDRDAGEETDELEPEPVLAAANSIVPLTGVASMHAAAVSCALMRNKDLLCWGVNLYGQVGTGAGTYVPAPVLMANGTPLKNVERVEAGFTRTCAFTTDGTLYCWGRNSEGQFGDGTFVNHGSPTPIRLTCP